MNEENLKTLIKKRGILKASVTRIGIAINNLELPDPHFLRVKLRNLKEFGERYDELQSQIECSTKDSETASEDRIEMEEVLCTIECKILKLLDNSNNADGGNGACNNVQLQPIKIPFFNGNILEWQHYFTMFMDLVNSRKDLSDIQKLHYLHSSLKDEPFNIIKNIPITNENYRVALDLLKNRYDNKLIITMHHVQNLLKINTMERESVRGLVNFLNIVTSAVNSLNAMQLPVNTFEIIVTQLLVSRLDPNNSRLWKEGLSDEKFPTFKGFIDFLNNRRQLLENVSSRVEPTKSSNHGSAMKHTQETRHVRTYNATTNGQPVNKHLVPKKFKCTLCKEGHLLYVCRKYRELTVGARREFLIKQNCCLNCLGVGHDVHACAIRGVCKICGKRHHTSIHSDEINVPKAGASYCSLKLQTNKNILLSTALVDAIDNWGHKRTCRVLLDSASQANFCTLKFARQLQLDLQPNSLPITGINNSYCQSKHSVVLRLHSRYEQLTFEVPCSVLPNITHKLPSESFDASQLKIPEDLYLADPDFNIAADIDVLIGAQFYLRLLRPKQFFHKSTCPTIQETRLGYILGGSIPISFNKTRPIQSFFSKVDQHNISNVLEKFWDIEEVSTDTSNTRHSDCETHFLHNVSRAEDGRFVVSLPRNPCNSTLGDSLLNAKGRFLNLEHKFKTNPMLREGYSGFMKEYLDLGHMSPINDDSLFNNSTDVCYLPHHAVFKRSSLTTRLRVVFDGSAKTSNGVSLNDTLLVGPTVQQDLLSILLRFRIHKYVMVADITKMYRQILVKPSDRDLQRILWRDSPTNKLQHFKLNTVTYGTASASFLATRCLLQIGKDSQDHYPTASRVIQNDFYVDDLITGLDTLTEIKQLKDDLIKLLGQYGFSLHKWFANDQRVVPTSHSPVISLSKDQNIRTLGICWDYNVDTLSYEITKDHNSRIFTKRNVLSIIAGIYDPLGLIGPVVFLCKHYMQQLWLQGVGWDEPIADTLLSQWSKIYDNLESIKNISIPRSIKTKGLELSSLQLVGFADASNKGYACCIYIRATYIDGSISCNLLCSKSRVAPVRPMTLPRGELCACLLLARLLAKVTSSLNMTNLEVHLFSDSMVALHWIHAQSHRWKTFVANRVSKIQELTRLANWHHVKSHENPADLISRGCLPHVIINSSLWWNGPHWLLDESPFRQIPPFQSGHPSTLAECQCEERVVRNVALTLTIETNGELSEDFSSLARLNRVYAWCLRFVHNARSEPSKRLSGKITLQEKNKALKRLIYQLQLIHFQAEFNSIQNNIPLSKQSKLISLNPFLDSVGLMRVGGRLQQSELGYDSKHPLILPPRAHLTKLIIESEHCRLLHAGPQLTHHSLRQRYWIINGKSIVRSVIRRCLTCFRFCAKRQSQLLGQLPAPRVTPSRPFLVSAIDYGGPFMIRHGGQRSRALSKAYVALFICLATKAIHLELVSDLTADAFIAALRRFTSRRGLPARIYSDNGTNFKAANNILHDLYTALTNEDLQASVQSFAHSMGIEWTFIPPSSPHFGGLWESGIRSMKFHLRRVVGKAILTFEEFNTVITQIEACLNSRPLFATSTDGRDPEPLTPGHFLIGAPLTALPSPDFSEVSASRLGRWQLLQKFIVSIWKSWSRDYLNQLQQRYKWAHESANVSPGDLVLLCDDNTPPLSWRRGIVVDTFPGPDGLIRVVNVRTSNGSFRRPVHKLCLLPKQDSETERVSEDKVK